MEKYAIYTYQLKNKPRRREGELEFEEPLPSNLTAEQKFELLFGPKGADVPIQKFNSSSSVDKKPCVVLNHDDNIIMLRLVNEKGKDIWEEKTTSAPVSRIEKTKTPSKPYCIIIIDNRPNAQIIAIQTGTDAWKSPNKVVDLLQGSFNWLLDVKNYGLEVSIMSKMMPTKFWDYVQKKKRDDNVYIKNMSFAFANHLRRPELDIQSALSSKWRRFDTFIEWINQLGGDKGEIRIEPPRNDALMKRKLADIKHMVEICMVSDYSLSVTFSDNVTYKCNQEVRAEMPMKDIRIRNRFEEGFKALFKPYHLTEWLDDIIEKTKQYRDVEEIRAKPVRKAKKQVS